MHCPNAGQGHSPRIPGRGSTLRPQARPASRVVCSPTDRHGIELPWPTESSLTKESALVSQRSATFRSVSAVLYGWAASLAVSFGAVLILTLLLRLVRMDSKLLALSSEGRVVLALITLASAAVAGAQASMRAPARPFWHAVAIGMWLLVVAVLTGWRYGMQPLQLLVFLLQPPAAVAGALFSRQRQSADANPGKPTTPPS